MMANSLSPRNTEGRLSANPDTCHDDKKIYGDRNFFIKLEEYSKLWSSNNKNS